MTTRRRFIEIVPFAGAALLAACSDKAAPPAPAAAPAPAPEPAAVSAPAPAPAAAAEPAAATAAPSAAMPMVDEKDPTAVALGYVSDATKADTGKYKNYVAGMACGNCALFQGKAGDASGPCPLFGGRQVSAKGWCGSYSKKAS